MWKKRYYNDDEEFNPFKVFVDLLSALCLILLLLLLIFLLNYKEEEDHKYDETAVVEETTDGNVDYVDNDEYNNQVQIIQNGGGGGGDTDTTDKEENPKDEQEYDYSKAAVRVVAVDAETEQVINEEGITFDLYNGYNKLQSLYTYYPEKIEYKEFKTTSEGSFYFPEKIILGGYVLKNITEPIGYDLAADTVFAVEESYDWPEALVVKVPFSVAKNVIYIKCVDEDTGKELEGCTFTITADEDITTADGTVRYTKGQEVGTISTDSSGEAQSEEFYLGKYTLTQTDAPKGYVNNNTLSYQLEKRTNSEEAKEIKVGQTTVNIVITDELTGESIKDVEFSSKDFDETFSSDENGKIKITEFDKNKSYEFKEISAPEGYTLSIDTIKVDVDEHGLIDNRADASFEVTDHMIRVSINIEDVFLNRPINGVQVELLDESGNTVENWTHYGEAFDTTTLPPGSYRIRVENKEISIEVKDIAKKQNFTYSIFTTFDLILIIGVCSAIIGIIGFILFKKKKHKKNT